MTLDKKVKKDAMKDLHRSVAFQIAKERGYKSPRDERAKREATRIVREFAARMKGKMK